MRADRLLSQGRRVGPREVVDPLAGGRSWLFLGRLRLSALLFVFLLSVPVAAADFTVQVVARGEVRLDGAFVTARSVGPDEQTVVRRAGVDPETLQGVLDLEADRAWTVGLEGQQVWAAEVPGVKPAEQDLLSLGAWPAGELVVPVRPRDGKFPEGGGQLYFRSSDSGRSRTGSPLSGESPCRIDTSTGDASGAGGPEGVVQEPSAETRVMRCSLPAGEWNLVLRVPPFMPVHDWGVTVAAGGELRLPRQDLRRGASLVGQVVASEGAVDPSLAKVRAKPVRGSAERSPAPGHETSLNAQGWFLFQGLPPGTYSVLAEQPGFAPARIAPVQVVEDRETALVESLVLYPPVRLHVHLEPARDAAGAPWKLVVQDEDAVTGVLQEVAEGRVDEEGRWRSAALAAGHYRMRVEDDRGNVVWVEEGLELEPDMLPLWIELPQVPVEGRVLLGEDGAAGANLYFGGRSGEPRVVVRADEEGAFSAVLPRDGVWPLTVEGGDLQVLAYVEVEVGEDGDDALRIRLPDTRLEGRVVDPDGAPATGALVRVVRPADGDVAGTLAGTRTDGEGDFLLRGLEPGNYQVRAEQGPLRSDSVSLRLAEAEDFPLTLTLRAVRAVEGRLVSDAAGVAGAPIVAIPHGGGGSGTDMIPRQQVTDPTGSFSLPLPAGTARTTLLALPVGFGFTVATMAVESPLVLPVASADGTLVLEGGWRGGGGEVGLVAINGEMVDPNLLHRWAEMNGGVNSDPDRLVVPAMPAGTYRLCRVTLQEATLVLLGRAHPTRCRDGELFPGGELVLSLP